MSGRLFQRGAAENPEITRSNTAFAFPAFPLRPLGSRGESESSPGDAEIARSKPTFVFSALPLRSLRLIVVPEQRSLIFREAGFKFTGVRCIEHRWRRTPTFGKSEVCGHPAVTNICVSHTMPAQSASSGGMRLVQDEFSEAVWSQTHYKTFAVARPARRKEH
jgi:hypothetical protein